MYVVAGASGQVGRATAAALLRSGKTVRALVISEAEQREWLGMRQEAAVVDFYREETLAGPLSGAEAAFIMIPPNYNARADYSEARQIISSFITVLQATRPRRVVCLSSIGGHRTERLGLIEQSHILEDSLGSLDLPISIIRPAWFMENAAWQISTADREGKLESFLYPLDRAIPMTATVDIGSAIATLMTDHSQARRVVEIEGPRRYSPSDLAEEMQVMVGRPVETTIVPRSDWHDRFIAEGSPAPSERIAMLDGFNSGWIDFEGPPCEKQYGSKSLQSVLADLIFRYRASQ
jgi:NAD(P)H dehydrogenase (quinone)